MSTDDSTDGPLPEGWIEVTHRYRLWASVPPEERVTKQMILDRAHDPKRPSSYDRAEMERLDAPPCVVANRSQKHGGKWAPCGLPVSEGADRCATHGGPRKPPTTRQSLSQLQAEVLRLRAELARRDTPA